MTGLEKLGTFSKVFVSVEIMSRIAVWSKMSFWLHVWPVPTQPNPGLFGRSFYLCLLSYRYRARFTHLLEPNDLTHCLCKINGSHATTCPLSCRVRNNRKKGQEPPWISLDFGSSFWFFLFKSGSDILVKDWTLTETSCGKTHSWPKPIKSHSTCQYPQEKGL